MKPSALFFLLLFSAAFISSAQQNSIEQDKLAATAHNILYNDNDSSRIGAMDEFIKSMQAELRKDASFQFPFDSLKNISILVPGDSSFRIFSWILPLSDGTFRYGGLIQMNPNIKDTVFVLTDCSENIPDPGYKITGPEEWYGALYYEIIDSGHDDKLYTLLGWDGKDASSNRKIIEVLSFSEDWIPGFGAMIFSGFEKGNQSRILIDYSENTLFSMKYAYPVLYDPEMGRKLRRKYSKMIIIDRLIPIHPGLADDCRYLVSSGEIFDAFIPEDKHWIYKKDIEVKDIRKKNMDEDQPPIEQGLWKE